MTTPDSEPRPSGVLSGPDVGTLVVRGGLQRATGFAAINLITAFAAVLLLRHLGVDNFGRYGTVMALLTIVQGISDAGLSMTGSRELSLCRTEREKRDLLAHLVGLRIVLSGGGVLFAVVFAVAVGYARTLVEGTALAGGGIFLLSVQSGLLLPLVVELENWRLAINDVLRQFVLVLCFVALTLAGASLLPFFGAQLGAALVVLLITPLLLLHRGQLVAPRWTVGQIRRLAAQTLPLAISGVLSVLYFRLLVILMSVLEGSAAQIGYYVTSARIIEIFLGLPVMLVGVVLPVLSVSSRDNTARLNYVTLRMTQTLGLLGVLLALILGVGARPIILILGGPQYLHAASVLQIQCVALITIFITGAWTTTLVGVGRTRALALSTAIGVAAVAAFGGALIPPLGAKGAAIAAVAADIVFCAAIFVSMRSAGAATALTPGPFIRIALSAAPAAALAGLSPLPQAVNTVLAAGSFMVLAWRLGALPVELSARVRTLLLHARGVFHGSAAPQG
jgi:O-antigen/teichoic acid export membrane protein